MFSLFTAPLVWVARKLIGSFVDGMFGTPLETDFGDSNTFDGNGYKSNFVTTLHPVALADVLEALSAHFQNGIKKDAITRAVRRVAELRLNHSAHLFLQIATAAKQFQEMKIDLHKDRPGGCTMSFSGPKSIIAYVRQVDALLGDVGRKCVPDQLQSNRVSLR